MIDLHVHTWRCRHAEGIPADYVEAAASCGVSTLAFTDHLPLPDPLIASIEGASGYAMPMAEIEDYVAEVIALKSGSSDVEVLLGIEADLVPQAVAHAGEVVARYPFDIVLGSIHLIDEWAFDDPDRTDGYDAWDVSDLWERYFADLTAAARTGVADVIAHVDLVKKFNRVPAGDLGALYRRVARALADSGVAVEVNTAGLRKPCAELYPSAALLAELRRANVPATVGSDAHRPEEVGAGWLEARRALHDAGYGSVLVFRGRVAQEVGLDDL